ncbi:hypothetical protein Tco_1115754 [Tanacetum coccineum]
MKAMLLTKDDQEIIKKKMIQGKLSKMPPRLRGMSVKKIIHNVVTKTSKIEESNDFDRSHRQKVNEVEC